MRAKHVSLAVISALGLLIGPTAASAANARTPAQAQSAEATQTALPSEVTEALERDLDLTTTELRTRLANEEGASQAAQRMERLLGASFGGAWLAGDDADLTVAITDPAKAGQVRAAGAVPQVMANSQDALEAVHAALDRNQASAPTSVYGWYLDVTTNRVVVQTDAAERSAAAQFVADSGVDADAVRLESAEQPRPLFDARGGDAYFTPNARCSIGFSVVGGYTTAGHCGTAGTSTSGFNQIAQGSFQDSVFPSNDHAWVAVNQDWDPLPVVNNYQGGTVTVLGSQEAPVGASICRSGSTTGWQCGTVEATNQTVQYPQGTVFGLTQTSACAEPGDSGGSFISGNQAQGMTSGGSGNCTFGGTTFFQPLNPTLQAFGLTLVTG